MHASLLQQHCHFVASLLLFTHRKKSKYFFQNFEKILFFSIVLQVTPSILRSISFSLKWCVSGVSSEMFGSVLFSYV